MKTRLIVVLAVCAGLTACASGPAYRAASEPGDYGYRDTMLTNRQYRVSFTGDYSMALETVQNFALFRAADVAIAHGASRFRVTSRETTPVTSQGPSYYGGPSFGLGYGGYGYGNPYFGTGFGYTSGGVAETRYDAVLQIQIGPDVPDQGPNVYDAEQIKKNLSANVAADQDK